MTDTPWHLGRLAAFDLETTGIDVEQDRIVTAAVILVGDGRPAEPHGWLANPGIEIPEQATAVHGVTTEQARTQGRPAPEVAWQVSELLAEQVKLGLPIVAMNARYDLTLLDRELERYQLPSLAEQAGRAPFVVDPYVIDKQADKYRKGKRTLTALCEHYGVTLDNAHDSSADALAAARLAYVLAVRYPRLGRDLELLHIEQTRWARQQAVSLQEYLRKSDPAAVVAPEWPLIPRQQNGTDQ